MDPHAKLLLQTVKHGACTYKLRAVKKQFIDRYRKHHRRMQTTCKCFLLFFVSLMYKRQYYSTIVQVASTFPFESSFWFESNIKTFSINQIHLFHVLVQWFASCEAAFLRFSQFWLGHSRTFYMKPVQFGVGRMWSHWHRVAPPNLSSLAAWMNFSLLLTALFSSNIFQRLVTLSTPFWLIVWWVYEFLISLF